LPVTGGALRRRLPELVSPSRQFIKVTKAGHLFSSSSVFRQPGGALDLKTALDITRQPLAQNPMLYAVFLFCTSNTEWENCLF